MLECGFRFWGGGGWTGGGGWWVEGLVVFRAPAKNDLGQRLGFGVSGSRAAKHQIHEVFGKGVVRCGLVLGLDAWTVVAMSARWSPGSGLEAAALFFHDL